ncbi:MAG: hypothetical protein ACRETH_00500 [Steroidobacteraceae bacterium]
MVVAMTLAQACVTTQGAPPYPGAPSTPLTTSDPPTSPNASNSSAQATSGASAHVDTAGYSKDQPASQALTDYLTQHRLPLVGAQVLRGPGSGRAVVLYGFTGSDFGKSDAVDKTRKYLNDSAIAVDNRIKVNPDLLTAGNVGASPGAGGAAVADNSPDPADNMPGAESYTQHQNDVQQYAQSQSNGAAMSSISPLLMMGLIGLAIASGGMLSLGSGSAGPPGFSNFGGAPYNPYPGYPSGVPGSNPYGP